MKYCFIINPASGKPETKANLEEKIKETAAFKGLDVYVTYTDGAGDASRIIKAFAREHIGEDIRFYACGGDGTLCEAVNGVMSLDGREHISLGVVPVGTGNDFVRSFSGGKECFLDIDAQLDAEAMPIDLIRCNRSYAVNMINIGFDCQVVVKTAKYKKKKFIPSKLAYICGLVVTLVKKPWLKTKIGADGQEPAPKEYLLITFAKGNFCGGGFNSNPEARLNDGKINSLAVKNISRTRFIGLVGSYKNGTHLCPENEKILRNEKASEYALKFDKLTNISVDGEIMSVNELRLCCEEGALNFLVPRGSAYPFAQEAAEAVTV